MNAIVFNPVGVSKVVGESMNYKLPLILEPQPEGGYTVTSPLIPEFLTEGDSVEDAIENARDAFAAVLEIYRDLGKPLPAGLSVGAFGEPVRADVMFMNPTESLRGERGVIVADCEGVRPVPIAINVRLTALAYRESDGRYSIVVPSLRGCFSAANAIEEAAPNATDAAEGWLEAMYDQNLPDILLPSGGSVSPSQ